MAFYDTTWYTNSVGYAAVTARPQNTAVAAGILRRQFTAPAVGSERVFACIVAGTTANVTDATWVLTRGAKTTDGTATWQECTGASAVNGDLTNTATWTQAKAIGTPTLGAIIQRNNGASYQICTTAGTMAASEPSFSDTAGVTTNDGTSVWTSLGVVGNFSGGGAPFARLAGVFGTNWFAAGNTIYVGDNHAESQSTNLSMSSSIGVITLMSKILCHNHSGSYPPSSGNITTGATVATTGNTSMTFNFGGGTYIYGVTFKAGSGATGGSGPYLTMAAVTSVSGGLILDNCSLQLPITAVGASQIAIGTSAGNANSVILNATTMFFGNSAQNITIQYSQLAWLNTGQILVSGSSVPTSLFNINTATAAVSIISLEALDLGQLTGAVCTISSGNFAYGNMLIKDCKLNASMTFPTPGQTGYTVQFVRCDSSGTAYKSARYTYEGTETTETSIARVGGAVDPTGQAQSRKIVTTANSQWLRPFKAEPYATWNTVTGANVTVTVYGTINSASLPNNDDIWLEVEYLGSSATPLGTIVTTTKASLLASNAAVASDGSSWNGGGSGAGWSPFKLVATLSSPQPGMAGYIDVRVRAAKASTTWYVDPKIELT